MNRKLLALILAAGMTVLALTGCGKAETVDEEAVVSEENLEENAEESVEDTAEYYVSVQVYGFAEALLIVTTSDGEGGSYEEETSSYGWFGSPGMTIGQMMEEWDIISLEAVCEGQELLGWVAYEQVIEVDENGFEEYNFVKLYDGKVFSTEEMLALELPAGDITFRSVWDLTCGGCENNKVCEIYYIDDDVYYVCDDCYEEFAHGMGLI